MGAQEKSNQAGRLRLSAAAVRVSGRPSVHREPHRVRLGGVAMQLQVIEIVRDSVVLACLNRRNEELRSLAGYEKELVRNTVIECQFQIERLLGKRGDVSLSALDLDVDQERELLQG